MSALIGCSANQTKDSFCQLYTPVRFTTIAAAACVIDNNDGAEADINANELLYDRKCK